MTNLIKEMDPKILFPNGKNPRKHTKRQKEAYQAYTQELSHEWLSFPIFNQRTNKLLDGHMRVELAIKEGKKLIPVRVIDVSEEEELFILQHFDSIGDLATIDRDAFQELVIANDKKIAKMKGESKKRLQALSENFKAFTESTGQFIPDTKPKGTKEKKEKVTAEVPIEAYFPPEDNNYVTDTIINNSVLFDADNEYGIPNLFEEHLLQDPSLIPTGVFARGVGSRVRTYYCESARPFSFQENQGGVLGFYTEDWRFEKAYKSADIYAELLMKEQWDAIITPDFSTYYDWPFTLKLFNVYRSRWCGRLWQELPTPQKIIPTIQDMGNDDLNLEVVVTTLPENTPIVSMQMRKATNRTTKDFSSYIRLADLLKTECNTEHVILYGGAPYEKYIHSKVPDGMTFHYLSQFIVERKTR